MKLRSIYNYLIDFVLPNRCLFCSKFIPWNKAVCDNCAQYIVLADLPVRYDENGVFSLCVSVCEYDGIARDGILNLKYHNGINTASYLCTPLCDILKEHIPFNDIDLVTSVPMTRKRRAQTGYNHAEIVAKFVSKELDLPLDNRLLARKHKASVQHELSAEERRLAVKGTYFPLRSHKDIRGKTILLCDDIITTGSTLSECASVLLSMGAKRVYCATLGKSVYNESRKE